MHGRDGDTHDEPANSDAKWPHFVPAHDEQRNRRGEYAASNDSKTVGQW
ncbi:MAG: hypothetical protein ABSE57_10115 [Bryobacteraceae bacterium]